MRDLDLKTLRLAVIDQQVQSVFVANAAYSGILHYLNRDLMLENIARLEPVLNDSNEEIAALEEREKEMARLIHQFKNYLLIEKIKLDTWQEPE